MAVQVEQPEMFEVPAPLLAVVLCRTCPQKTVGVLDTMRLRGWRLPNLPPAPAQRSADPDQVQESAVGYCPICAGRAASPIGYVAQCATCTAMFEHGDSDRRDDRLNAVEAVLVAAEHECDPDLYVGTASNEASWVLLGGEDGRTPAHPLPVDDPSGYVAHCETCDMHMAGAADRPFRTAAQAIDRAVRHVCPSRLRVAVVPIGDGDYDWWEPADLMPDGTRRPPAPLPPGMRLVETLQTTDAL